MTHTKSTKSTPAVHATPKTKPVGGVSPVAVVKPPKHGVLGAAATLKHQVANGTLPFTGMPLWLVSLVGLQLVGLGVLGRRAGRNRA